LELGSLRRDALLFGESSSRVILSTRPDSADLLLSRAADAGIPAGRIGTVGGDRFVIDVPKGRLSEGCRIDLPIQHVRDRWANALEEQLSHE
jgi:phosphoribosylformylglycinamidine synthase